MDIDEKEGEPAAAGPPPKPELHEPKVPDPGLRDLTFADWKAVFVRAAKEFMNDNATMLASALAYSSFFAIPAVLLVTVGVFTLVAGPDTITSADRALRHGDAEAGDRAARQLAEEPRRASGLGRPDDGVRLRARASGRRPAR